MIYIIESLLEAYGRELAEVEEEVSYIDDDIEYVQNIFEVPRGAMYHDGISIKSNTELSFDHYFA